MSKEWMLCIIFSSVKLYTVRSHLLQHWSTSDITPLTFFKSKRNRNIAPHTPPYSQSVSRSINKHDIWGNQLKSTEMQSWNVFTGVEGKQKHRMKRGTSLHWADITAYITRWYHQVLETTTQEWLNQILIPDARKVST